MKSDFREQYSSKLGGYEKTDYLGDILDITFPEQTDVPATFIYGKDIYMREKNRMPSVANADVTYGYSLMPQNTEPLALFLAMTFNKKGNGLYDYKQTVTLLKHMLEGFYVLDPASVIYLATSMFSKMKDVKIMAGEVLIKSIDENRLPVEDTGSKLGMLANRHYAQINRMLGVLGSVKDVSQKHNDALFKLLENILPEIRLTDTMPDNVKKVLEMYYDLKHKLNRPVSPSLETALNELEGLKLLQPIINKIKK